MNWDRPTLRRVGVAVLTGAVLVSPTAVADAAPSASLPLGGARLTITLHLAPRHASELARLAAARRVRPRPIGWLRAHFAPTRATTDAVDRYLTRRGFSLASRGILTRTYVGSVAAAGGASTGRGRPSLPPGLARRVTSIDGLVPGPVVHPLIDGSEAASTLTSCAGASQLQALKGGYQPAQLASADAYDFQSLLDGGDAGQSDVVALIEFSNYTPSNVATYQSCYGTSVPITDVPVNGGTTDRTGASEVQLDAEVAATAAPGLAHVYTYIAPNDGSTSWGSMLDTILIDQPTTHTNIISISWGDCERPGLFADMRSDDIEFQLAKAAGLTVVVASGDSGSDDCGYGSYTYRVDYPSSSPFVTGVGGTTLHLGVSGAGHETTWGHPDSDRGTGGGGGASIVETMPSWQTGPGVISADTRTTCGAAGDRPCREVPDVALDANPVTGYIVYSGGRWRLFGGTSAGAPLLAAMIADADTYSLAHGGRRMGGGANPFFYAHAGAPLFRDITVGSNNIYAQPSLHPATAGYDMATGLGAPGGVSLARLLLADTTGATLDRTSLSGAESMTTITPGAGATLHGTLTDQTTGQPLAGRTITIANTYAYAGHLRHASLSAVTDASGSWSVQVTTAIAPTRLTWRALYGGQASHEPGGSAAFTLLVRPALTLASPSQSVTHGVAFTVTGTSTPNMAGRSLTVQKRAAGSSTWQSTGASAVVAANGTYSATVTLPTAGMTYLRFSYHGSTTGPWVSAHSPKALFTVG